MYKCKHFEIHELVPKQIYLKRKEKAWELMDVRILKTIDMLRNRYGRMKINDYYWNGVREWSGLRTVDSPYYSKTSQHTFGRAVDIIFLDSTTDLVRNDILDLYNKDKIFRFINAMELGTNWLHIDVRNCKRLKTFYP